MMRFATGFLSFLVLLGLATPSYAQSEKERQWNLLIAEAKRHGGVETIINKTGSYVFGGPNGLIVAFTRTLDNKRHFVCAMYLSANIQVCASWETEKMLYSTRTDEHSPWIVSDNPPPEAEAAPSTPIWLDLLSAFLGVGFGDEGGDFDDHAFGARPYYPHFARRAGVIRAFRHGFAGGRHR